MLGCKSVRVLKVKLYQGMSDFVYNRGQAKSKKCSIQFSSITQSCPTLCDPMDSSMPGFPVFNYLPEFAQTHVH